MIHHIIFHRPAQARQRASPSFLLPVYVQDELLMILEAVAFQSLPYKPTCRGSELRHQARAATNITPPCFVLFKESHSAYGTTGIHISDVPNGVDQGSGAVKMRMPAGMRCCCRRQRAGGR
jgi:hypothetical protein